MANRGQKRTEAVDALPADKRACSSLESRPSSSNSSVQTPMSSAHEAQDADMEASSSTSGSTGSDGFVERESTYGSCDSENNTHDYQRHRSSCDQSKLQKVLQLLSKEGDESGQLAALTELCELLSFCTDGSISSIMVDTFSPVLVRLARNESNPEIMLLALRAITYFCDVNQRSARFLVRDDVVPALCQRLITIEYLDVAEQCLQALAKISQEQPLACLQSDAIMAALTYIDFFSTSVQRVALSTAVNICKKLSSESPSHFMEAVPTLCSILQYEDMQLVESSVSCLIKIVEQVSCSSDMLDKICKNGLVQHSLHLIGLNAQTALSPQTYTGLIGLLAKLAAGSNIAFRTLLELNIGNKVKDMLSASSDLSHGTRSTLMLDGKCNRLHQVLKLLNELLPAIAAEQDGGQNSVKETFLLENPDILQKFGLDILPVLVQVVNSGVNLFICYGCLSVINKLIHFSTSDALHSLLQTTEFPSFLGGIFTRKDHHVILLALQIIDATMHKLPRVYLTSFIKEGIVFALHALLSKDKDLTLSTLFDGIRMESNGTPRSTSQGTRRCPCFGFDAGHSLKSPENTTCKLQKDSAQYLAKHILVTYFELESVKPDKGVTCILQKLRALSDALTAEVNKFQDEETYNLLKQIISELNETDSVSTFEFVESGIMRALVSYLSNGRYIVGKEVDNAANFSWIMEKRLEVLGRLLLFSAHNPTRGELPLLALIWRLQSALSSIENFPVISSHSSKPKNSYALVPFGRCTSYPSLKVQFVREEGEVSLRDYAEDLVSVDPFVPLDAIEGYLWPRVSSRETKHLTRVSKDLNEKDIVCSSSPPNSSTSQGKIADTIISDRMQVDDHTVQDGKARLSPPREASSYAQRPTGTLDADDVQTDPRELNENNAQVESGLYMDSPECSEVEDTQRKLLFFLERKKLNGDLTLYQSILMQQTHDSIQNANLWTRLFRITYKRGMKSKQTHAKFVSKEAQSSFSSETASFSQGTRFFSDIFLSAADPEILGPTYDVLFLLNLLEAINRLRFHITFRDRTLAFAEGRMDNLDNLNVEVHGVPQNEFVNKKLTEKLDQLIFDNVSVSAGAMPAWCTQLIAWCPFLFGFDARCKYFHLAALGRPPIHADSRSHGHAGGSSGRQQNHGSTSRRKVMVHRDRILESAAEMMKLYSRHKVVLEVEYEEEVGSGLGPTLEFYTLVCQEFQRIGLCMWRDDPLSHGCSTEYSRSVPSPFGLFPRPMSPAPSMSSNKLYSEVIKKYALLGQIVAKALQDGRVLDLPLSKAFYKLILGKELTVYDIQSFDPALGKALLELLAVVERTKYLSSLCEEKSNGLELGLRCTKIEDLCLDFSLPGYPDYLLITESDSKMVNLDNLEEYISLVVEATIKSGIASQVEAFKSGFSEVFHITHLKVFMEEELERLLCGEQVLWNSNDLLDHIKFDHGYTVSSPPIVNLLEIMREFDPQQQRAFLQFVTGAPRLPIGGLASLNPKLTIVRKHCNKVTDAELPSVMTCANYLKLPPYSCREVMKEKLFYAITEGQGSFHLS